MSDESTAFLTTLFDALAGIDSMDQPHVLVVEDPLTCCSNVYGPYPDSMSACLAAEQFHKELLDDDRSITVTIAVRQLHPCS